MQFAKPIAKVALLVTIVFWSAPTVLSQGQLPEGEGKETVQMVCSRCHGLDKLTAFRRSPQEWEELVSDMAARGAALMLDEVDVIIGYLSRNLAPRTQNLPMTSSHGKVNVNQATAQQMEADLGFAENQARQIVSYREQNGKFSSWEDLKRVPGMDHLKLEILKDRLAF